MTEAAQWQQQWQRVGRWFERFANTAGGREHDRHSDHYHDEIYAFFLNCFHLKDWLQNDPASASAASDVERFVNGSVALSICADLANGSKHLVLDRPRVGTGAKFGARLFKLNLGGVPRISAEYAVEANGKKYDAFKLAKECIAEWTGYLQSKGLLT
jgi:hypothetical protein